MFLGTLIVKWFQDKIAFFSEQLHSKMDKLETVHVILIEHVYLDPVSVQLLESNTMDLLPDT